MLISVTGAAHDRRALVEYFGELNLIDGRVTVGGVAFDGVHHNLVEVRRIIRVKLHLAELPVAVGGAGERTDLPESLERRVLVLRKAQILDPAIMLSDQIMLRGLANRHE